MNLYYPVSYFARLVGTFCPFCPYRRGRPLATFISIDCQPKTPARITKNNVGYVRLRTYSSKLYIFRFDCIK